MSDGKASARERVFLAAKTSWKNLGEALDEFEAACKAEALAENSAKLAKLEEFARTVRAANAEKWLDTSAEMVTAAVSELLKCPACGFPIEPTGSPRTHRLCDCPKGEGRP